MPLEKESTESATGRKESAGGQEENQRRELHLASQDELPGQEKERKPPTEETEEQSARIREMGPEEKGQHKTRLSNQWLQPWLYKISPGASETESQHILPKILSNVR